MQQTPTVPACHRLFIQPSSDPGRSQELLPEAPITALTCGEGLAFIAGGKGASAYLAAYCTTSLKSVAMFKGSLCSKLVACGALQVRCAAGEPAAGLGAACVQEPHCSVQHHATCALQLVQGAGVQPMLG